MTRAEAALAGLTWSDEVISERLTSCQLQHGAGPCAEGRRSSKVLSVQRGDVRLSSVDGSVLLAGPDLRCSGISSLGLLHGLLWSLRAVRRWRDGGALGLTV